MPKTERRGRGGGVQQLDNNSARQSDLEKLWSERPPTPYSQSSVQFFSLYNTLIICEWGGGGLGI
jgi:hypothetical protein